MKFRNNIAVIATGILLTQTPRAVAGMSTITLSKFGADRLIGLSTIAFLLIVVAATTLTYCWNGLVKETNWPRLTHPKAIAFSFLAGLLSFLVLVMIAGSRELLSPGAWKPHGILYKIADEPNHEPKSDEFGTESLAPAEDTPQARLAVRREALSRIRAALWKYADEHDGTFPNELPQGCKAIPVAGGLKYRYDVNIDTKYLVLEPDMNEPPHWGLDRRGMIVPVDAKEAE